MSSFTKDSATQWMGHVYFHRLNEECGLEEFLTKYRGTHSGIYARKLSELGDPSKEVKVIKKALQEEFPEWKTFGQVGSFQAPGKLVYNFQIRGVPGDISKEEYLVLDKKAKEVISMFTYDYDSRKSFVEKIDFPFYSSVRFEDKNGRDVSFYGSMNGARGI